MKRRGTVSQSGARNVEVKERLKKKPVALDIIDVR